MDIYFAIMIPLTALGAWCSGYAWASYRKWKKGFDQGYELGHRHGCEKTELAQSYSQANTRMDSKYMASMKYATPPPDWTRS